MINQQPICKEPALIALMHNIQTISLKKLLSDIGYHDRGRQIAAAGLVLIGVLLYLLQFTYAYFDQSKQMYLGWGCLAVIFLLYKYKKSRQHPFRLIVLLLATFIALRYFEWRTFDTLLYTGPMDFIGMSLLYLVEAYGLVVFLMGLFLNIWPLESEILPLPSDVDKLPTVDVFIPTYNESDDIIRITATAATQMKYPKEKLRIYILDDGSSQAKRSNPKNGAEAWERHFRLRHMAADLGIGYLTRETNQQAKAGNLNHALGHTDGDVVLILDCDHVPTSDILQNTIGHFIADPKLFLVQTPHFFINPTPVEKNLEGRANPPSEGDMFYRRIQVALNFWNASYFCGSAALLRRKYLLEVGGICGTTITEDAETAFQLHSRGYNSIYINRPMVCGLSPESYDDFVVQRSRWAQGMTQMLVLNNPLKTKGLSLPQKILYFNSCFFWLFGFPRFVYFIAPATYLILGLNIYHASWLQIIAFTLPYVLSIYVVMDYFYAGSRQPFFSSIYESVQSLFLIPAIISVLINPWKPSFTVTPKGKTNDKNYLSPLAAPFFLVIAINIAAVSMAAVKWFSEPILRDVILVTGAWSIYNLYLSLVSLGAFWERKQVRKFYRISASGAVAVYFPRTGERYSGEVRDVSLTGIGFEIQLPFAPKEREQVTLEVEDSYGQKFRFENIIQRALKRNGNYMCGSEFILELESYPQVVRYVFGDSRRWQENWDMKSKSGGTLSMLWYFLNTGVLGFFGSVIPLLKLFLLQIWKLCVKWFTTPILRDIVLAASSWCVYHFYLILGSFIQLLNHKQGRKLQRYQTSGTATLYFPRLDATLQGVMTDVSMTGIGVIAELPFQIRAQEHTTIRAVGKDGEERRFPCLIQRVIKRDNKTLFGAEFIVDVASYPNIVNFVYGGNRQMLNSVSVSGEGMFEQAGQEILNTVKHMFNILGGVLAYVFLNRDAIERRQDNGAYPADAEETRQVKSPDSRLVKGILTGVGKMLALIFLNPKENK